MNITKYILIGVLGVLTSVAQAQFVPPDSNSTVMVNDSNEIVFPDISDFINTNFQLLTPSTGLSGTAYNGLTAQTWTVDFGTGITTSGNKIIVDTLWLVTNYHKALTAQSNAGLLGSSYNGTAVVSNWRIDTSWMDTNYAQNLTTSTGLLLDTGTTYNGKAPRTITVDRAYIEQVIRETAFVVDNYQIYIDTTPSINPYSYRLSRAVTISIQAPYYISIGNQTLTATNNTTDTENVVIAPSAETDFANATRTTITNTNTTYVINGGNSTRNVVTNSTGGTYPTTYSAAGADMYTQFAFWTDAEFKVVDASGNLIYWVSTQYGAQMGGGYTSHPATDLNAQIWYTCAENENTGTGLGRRWIKYVYNATNARTIYEHAQRTTGVSTPTIGGIIIQPNLNGTTVGGTSIMSIFGNVQGNTPNTYSYVYLKCSPTDYERSPNYPYNAIWRPYNALSTAIQKAR